MRETMKKPWNKKLTCGSCKFRTDGDRCMIYKNTKIAFRDSAGCSKGERKYEITEEHKNKIQGSRDRSMS